MVVLREEPGRAPSVPIALGRRTEDDRLSVAEPTGQHRTMKPVPEAALGAVRDTLREHGEPIAVGAMTFMQARMSVVRMNGTGEAVIEWRLWLILGC